MKDGADLKILLAGPFDTEALGRSLGIDVSALPAGTIQTPIAPLSAGLLRAGHELQFVTLDPAIDEVREFHRAGITVTYCPLRGAPKYRARVRSRDLFAREIGHLAEVMRASDADIVHAHWTYEYAEAAIRSRRPALVTMHDLGWDYFFLLRDLYRAMRLVMKYRVMVRAKHVTAVSPFVANKAWHYGYFGKVDVVPNPIEAADAPLKSLGRPVIATIGNQARLKNVAASVAAFATIRSAFPRAELHLFGPGLEPEGPFGGAGVTCHGNVPHGQLMRFLEDEATLLVHPSRMEACPVILGEAKMRGVPVVAGKSSGGVEYVVGDAGGVLVDIDRPEEIAAAAIAILSDAGGYRALQQAAHEDVAARFSVEQVAESYLAIYRRILGREGTGGRGAGSA